MVGTVTVCTPLCPNKARKALLSLANSQKQKEDVEAGDCCEMAR